MSGRPTCLSRSGTLPPGSVAGEVADLEHRPLNGHVGADTVILFLVKSADGHSINEVKTGPDGKGTLENLLPGVYEISEKSVPEPYPGFLSLLRRSSETLPGDSSTWYSVVSRM